MIYCLSVKKLRNSQKKENQNTTKFNSLSRQACCAARRESLKPHGDTSSRTIAPAASHQIFPPYVSTTASARSEATTASVSLKSFSWYRSLRSLAKSMYSPTSVGGYDCAAALELVKSCSLQRRFSTPKTLFSFL